MERLTIEEIIAEINAENTFHAVAEDYSFTLKVDEYVPYICGAVHDGHNFRKELWDLCTHSEYERWYEEDPATAEMIKDLPIVIASLDSRFEYDLNRSPEDAIYDDAWGKRLWKQPLSDSIKSKSLEKHKNFYKVVDALVSKIQEKFTYCVVYDLHSYNWKRWEREVPTWNLGTSNIDNNRFGDMVELWRKKLEIIDLPYGIEAVSKINDTFQGNGYFLKHITQNFSNSLVLATEIKKIYCDELQGVIYPEIVDRVRNFLKVAIPEHASHSYKSMSN